MRSLTRPRAWSCLELLASWSLPADGSLRGVGHCILGYAEDTLPEPKPRRDNVVYVR